MGEIDEYLKMSEFAQKKGVTRQAVRKAIDAGKIKDYRTFGRLTLIHRDEIERYTPNKSAKKYR